MNCSTLIVCLVLSPACAEVPEGADDRVRVTVVGIVATDRDTTIDPRLKGIVQAVQEKEPTLTGFRVVRVSNESVEVGGWADFSVCKEGKLPVRVAVNKSQDGKICITLKPPKHKGSVKYSCVCEKYVPIITRCVTPEGDRLLIAVMATPCRTKE